MLFRLMGSRQSVPSLAIFIGGSTGTANILTSEKYLFANHSVSSGRSITVGNELSYAGSNGSVAINAGGQNSGVNVKTTRKYVFSGDISTTTADLSVAKYAIGCTTTASLCVYSGGYTGAPVSATEKYSYSTDTYSSGGAMSPTNSHATGFYGNASTFGLFACGYNGSVMNSSLKYTYSTDTHAASSTLAYRYLTQSVENGQFCIGVSGGDSVSYLTDSQKYTFSTGVVSSSTSISSFGARDRSGCASNSSVGVIASGGNPGTIITSSLYMTFSTELWATGGSLSTARRGSAGASSTPSHL